MKQLIIMCIGLTICQFGIAQNQPIIMRFSNMTICATDDVYDAIDALTQKKEVVGKIELFGDTIKFIQNGSTTSLKILAGWKTKRDYVIRAELADESVWKLTFTPVSKNFNICKIVKIKDHVYYLISITSGFVEDLSLLKNCR